jgi:CPA2 family monovalent cation:H+ antiporter-2
MNAMAMGHELELTAFALALLWLMVGGIIAWLMRLPLVLGYLVAGIVAQTLLRPTPSLLLMGNLGIMLMLFFLGMGFDWRLLSSPHRWGVMLANIALNFLIPLLLLWLMGCPFAIAFFAAMAVYPTSSAVTLATLTQLRRLAYPETETIVWLAVSEDLTMLLLLALASVWAGSGQGVDLPIAGFGFVVAMLIASVALTKPLERLFRLLPSELDNLVTFAAIVAISALARTLQVSDALGAFLAGMLFSGTKDRYELERRLHLLRELGTALFFFVFGLQMPLSLTKRLLWGLGLVAIGIVGKVLTAWSAGRMDNLRPRARRRLLFSLWARGELSALALLVGDKVLPTVWKEALSWFIAISIVSGILALAFADRRRT